MFCRLLLRQNPNCIIAFIITLSRLLILTSNSTFSTEGCMDAVACCQGHPWGKISFWPPIQKAGLLYSPCKLWVGERICSFFQTQPSHKFKSCIGTLAHYQANLSYEFEYDKHLHENPTLNSSNSTSALYIELCKW